MFFVILTSILLSLVALVLIVVVLLQHPKDDGGNAMLGSNQIKQLVGVAEMPLFQRKVTSFLLGTLFVLSLMLSWLLSSYFGQSQSDLLA